MKASSPTTWWPSRSRCSHSCEPMKPAAPVTRHFMVGPPWGETRSGPQLLSQELVDPLPGLTPAFLRGEAPRLRGIEESVAAIGKDFEARQLLSCRLHRGAKPIAVLG